MLPECRFWGHSTTSQRSQTLQLLLLRPRSAPETLPGAATACYCLRLLPVAEGSHETLRPVSLPSRFLGCPARPVTGMGLLHRSKTLQLLLWAFAIPPEPGATCNCYWPPATLQALQLPATACACCQSLGGATKRYGPFPSLRNRSVSCLRASAGACYCLRLLPIAGGSHKTVLPKHGTVCNRY